MEYIGNIVKTILTLVSSSYMVINKMSLLKVEIRNTYPEKLLSELVLYESFSIEVLAISPIQLGYLNTSNLDLYPHTEQ